MSSRMAVDGVGPKNFSSQKDVQDRETDLAGPFAAAMNRSSSAAPSSSGPSGSRGVAGANGAQPAGKIEAREKKIAKPEKADDEKSRGPDKNVVSSEKADVEKTRGRILPITNFSRSEPNANSQTVSKAARVPPFNLASIIGGGAGPLQPQSADSRFNGLDSGGLQSGLLPTPTPAGTPPVAQSGAQQAGGEAVATSPYDLSITGGENPLQAQGIDGQFIRLGSSSLRLDGAPSEQTALNGPQNSFGGDGAQTQAATPYDNQQFSNSYEEKFWTGTWSNLFGNGPDEFKPNQLLFYAVTAALVAPAQLAFYRDTARSVLPNEWDKTQRMRDAERVADDISNSARATIVVGDRDPDDLE